MPRFEIHAGLGGGFGGAQFQYYFECADEDMAMDVAFEEACEQYEGYDGMHGISSVEDILQEHNENVEEGEDWEELTEEDADLMWREERESWLDYHVVEVK